MYQDNGIRMINGNCLDIMPTLEANSVDSIVTDSPYGLKFMGKDWDRGVPGVRFWVEMLRVAKPGCHLLAFGGTRTFHRLMVAIEDAGWEIRDTIMWVYGSGFPKSLNVGKAVDKLQGNERKVIGKNPFVRPNSDGVQHGYSGIQVHTELLTKGTSKWEGFGTALKPAWEPIIIARKPIDGTVAENVLKWGTGALNIDGCRVETDEHGERNHHGVVYEGVADGYKRPNKSSYTHKTDWKMQPKGRWPANLIHDGSQGVLDLFPNVKAGGSRANTQRGQIFVHGGEHTSFNDSGSAARFFYCPKASKADRDEGCEGLVAQKQDTSRKEGNPGGDNPRNRGVHLRTNNHPTVKPTSLMRYLCRLATPPNGTILDPFMGSGSTGKAARLEGFKFIGIELEPEYMEIAQARVGI